MKNTNTKQQRALAAIENAYTDFISFLDQIFYEGYAQQLASTDPVQFKLEYEQFFDNYFSKNK